jgi:hypothetical protein
MSTYKPERDLARQRSRSRDADRREQRLFSLIEISGALGGEPGAFDITYDSVGYLHVTSTSARATPRSASTLGPSTTGT